MLLPDSRSFDEGCARNDAEAKEHLENALPLKLPYYCEDEAIT